MEGEEESKEGRGIEKKRERDGEGAKGKRERGGTESKVEEKVRWQREGVNVKRD